jgi:hypothetical protein
MVLVWGVPHLMVKVAVDNGVSLALRSLARVLVDWCSCRHCRSSIL